MRNRRRFNAHSINGWTPSREVKSFIDTSEQYLEDARKVEMNDEKLGYLSQKALYFAMWGVRKWK
jgi:hypothetical protein